MRKRWLAWIGYLIATVSLAVNGWQYLLGKNLLDTHIVREITDGDTFITEDFSVIRLSSIGAPELDQCGGKEAKEFLETLIKGKRVRYEVPGRDSGGRQVAFVYLNDKLVNAEALKSGWFYYNGAINEWAAKLKPAYYDAKDNGRGIFGPTCTQRENPDDPKCSIKGNIARSSENSGEKIYHFPGCSRYEDVLVEKFRGERWFCSETEAKKAGYTKSAECYGKKFIK